VLVVMIVVGTDVNGTMDEGTVVLVPKVGGNGISGANRPIAFVRPSCSYCVLIYALQWTVPQGGARTDFVRDDTDHLASFALGEATLISTPVHLRW
jgi:hypothetical protein